MNLDRKVLICYILGFIDGMNKNTLLPMDKLILLDQTLIKFNMPPTTPEEKNEFIDELAGEIELAFMFGKVNHKTVRELGKSRKYQI